MARRASIMTYYRQSLDNTGDKGVKGIKGQKGESPRVVTTGYAGGGETPAVVTTIDSFPFSTPFTTASDVGDLSQARRDAAGQSSRDDGFSSGGFTPNFDTIDSFPFSTPFTVATDVGNLSQARFGAAGQSSASAGYTSGGAVVDTIDRFPFGTPFVTAVDIGNLSSARYTQTGQSSETDGYTSGGATFPPFVSNNIQDSFPFVSPFTTATDVGDLSQGRGQVAGQNSDTNGYTSGGTIAPPFGYTNTIDSFPFATPFTTSTDAGDLNQTRGQATGQSSPGFGYTSGGRSPFVTYQNTIDSFPFSAPFSTATDVGDLSQARSGAAGQEG